jgi:hypothetical protein
MHDTAIITALIAARDHGIDADISVESGLIRTGVDGFYRFHDDWTAAVDDLIKRVADAVEARR